MIDERRRAFWISSITNDPTLDWVRIDGFPRETVWEGREGREAWERANRLQR